MRVVSLLPSATEIVCSVGMADALVGVSHECDHPPEVRGLPVLTSSKVPTRGSSAQIDRDVREVVREALAVYDVDTVGLAEVDPDVIVTQDLCDVCAVSLADVERATRELTRSDVRIVNLHPTHLDDIWSDVRQVGDALGRCEEARELLQGLQERVRSVGRRAAEATRRNVLTLEWIEPVMVGGTWMPELVELAGGTALVTRPGQHAPTLSIDELAALDPAPEVVLVKPCGYDLERSRGELGTLSALFARLGSWPAVGEGELWVADGNAFFNRPGPRIVDSLEILAACVHPDRFEDLAALHAGSFERLTP